MMVPWISIMSLLGPRTGGTGVNQEDLQAHQTSLSISDEEHAKGMASPMVIVRVRG
jgi:hypothetical protein